MCVLPILLLSIPGIVCTTRTSDGLSENITISLKALQEDGNDSTDDLRKNFPIVTNQDIVSNGIDSIYDLAPKETHGDVHAKQAISSIVDKIANNKVEYVVGEDEYELIDGVSEHRQPVKRLSEKAPREEILKRVNDYYDGNGEARAKPLENGNQLENLLLRGLTRISNTHIQLFPTIQPTVIVPVIKPKTKGFRLSIGVPLSPDMTTVLQALVAATKTHIEHHGQHWIIPYNALTEWNGRLGCFVIVEALGVANNRRDRWFLTVQDRFNTVVYNGQCLTYSMFLLPRWTVKLAYRRVKRRSKRHTRTSLLSVKSSGAVTNVI